MALSQHKHEQLKHDAFERIVASSMWLAMVTVGTYAIINFFFDAFFLAGIQCIVFITLPIVYLWLKQGAPLIYIKHTLGLLSTIVFVPLLFAYSPEHTGLYWVFIFPLLVFYILGLNIGKVWVLIYYISIFIGILLTYFDYIPKNYTSLEYALCLVELTFFTIMSYFIVLEREKHEASQLNHSNHLECINQIEHTLHSHNSFEEGIQKALQAILDIFQCSRVWLIYPCNPGSALWSARFKSEIPDYPCPFDSKATYDINDGLKETFSDALKTNDPVCYHHSDAIPGETSIIETFHIQSQMDIAVYPNNDEPWLLGIHQCDDARTWNMDEQQLFKAISSRIGNALNQMLLYNNLKASTEQLAQASEKANAANLAKSEFLSVMSHELRTPLHGIIGLQELIAADKENLNAEQIEHLALAQQAAASLSELVNDILSLSKVEAGALELNESDTSIKQCLLDSIAPFVILCRKKKLPLKLNLDNVPEIISIDPTRLRQILINLIGNAVKFTEQGSVYLHVEEHAGMLSFHIHDTGIGISSDMMRNIFTPFVQEAALSKSSHQGTGLGTTIAKRFVEAMDGYIEVSSELSIGSCFSFHIPCKPIGDKRINWQVDVTTVHHQATPSYSEDAIHTEGSSNAATGLSILLAEDDPIGQRVAEKCLTRAGMQVDIASDGYIAWDKIKTGKYDVLLTDIRMPKLDGIQLTQRIRQYENKMNKPALTIIGLSAHVLDEVEQACLEAGINAFMSKPIDAESILKKVQKQMPS